MCRTVQTDQVWPPASCLLDSIVPEGERRAPRQDLARYQHPLHSPPLPASPVTLQPVVCAALMAKPPQPHPISSTWSSALSSAAAMMASSLAICSRDRGVQVSKDGGKQTPATSNGQQVHQHLQSSGSNDGIQLGHIQPPTHTCSHTWASYRLTPGLCIAELYIMLGSRNRRYMSLPAS